MKAKRLAELSVLTAVSLIIFIVELQIPNPFPIPGIKLGLANIITVFAVYHYRAYEVAMIVGVGTTVQAYIVNADGGLSELTFKDKTED